MQHIETVTVGSGGQADIDFIGLGAYSAYTDLLFVISARTTTGGLDNLRVQINGSTTTHSSRALYGTGSTAASAADPNTSNFPFMYVSGNYTANTFNNSSLYIANFSSTTQLKSISSDSVTENNATASFQAIQAGLFAETNPITSVRFYATNNLAEHTRIDLYGITAGSDGIVAVS